MARSSGIKVLRVAVVVDDLVCDELHQSRPEGLSVGTSYKSDVLLFGSRAPFEHRLFDYRNGDYYLDLPAHARGKITLGKKAITIGKLRQRFGRGDKLRVKLDPKSKGKLLLGESTLLFQFAAPKPLPPLLPFPREFRAKVREMLEKRYQYSLAASGAVLGSFFVYTCNTEPPPEDEMDIDDRFLAIVNSPVLDKKQALEEEEEKKEEDVLEQKDDKKIEVVEKEKPEPERLTERPEKFSQQAMKEARGVGVARVLGTYGGPGEGTVFDVIDQTENNLGELFAMGMTTTVLADGGDISEFVPGGEGISVSGAAVATKGFETSGGPALEAKAEKRERKVVGRTSATRTDITGDVDQKAFKATIRHRTGALQHCYNQALRTQPDLAGKMTYTIFISKMGTVTKVIIEEDSLGSSAVTSCTTAKIKGWRFPMEGATEDAEVTFSVVFSGS